jgi:tetratricopeptide (TPR) repeat protein
MSLSSLRAPLLALVVLLTSGPAATAGKDGGDARRLYDEATAAFGLGRYSEAAEKYEAAFEVRPDPALLYNAAQAYRLAGNKARALELYRNYIRLYPTRPNTPDARNHIAALTKTLDDERATSAPPAAPEPPPPAPAPVAPAAPEPPAPAAPALVASSDARPGEARPLVRRPWFWVAVGAAVIGGAAAVLLATRGTTYPDASLGKVPGN